MKYKIDLIACPTIRDINGLALSSRNQYLSLEEQKEAACFSKALIKLKKKINNGELNSAVLKTNFAQELSEFKKITIDYISIASKKTLDEIETVQGNVLISAAVFYNKTRLIDNFSYQSST